jgi:hypothetical protein
MVAIDLALEEERREPASITPPEVLVDGYDAPVTAKTEATGDVDALDVSFESLPSN